MKTWVKSIRLFPLLLALTSVPSPAADLSDCDHTSETNPGSSELLNLVNQTVGIGEMYGPYEKSPHCGQDPSDAYDPAYKISYGDYNGQCIDSSTVRPPVVLNQDEKQITIANFYHDGKFWIAKIPKDAVTSVIFQGIPFGDAAFGLIELKHGQFRFKLNRPVELYEQAGDKSETVSLDDLIVSSTATHPAGIDYNVLQGKNFGIATRVMSSTARGAEEIAVDGSRVHQYEVNLAPKQKSEFLVTSIERANQAGYKDLYHLLDANCATTAFDSLDATVARPDGVQPLRGKWWLIHDEIEKPALRALKDRQMPFKQVQDMNDEMNCAQEDAGSVADLSLLDKARAHCSLKSPMPLQ